MPLGLLLGLALLQGTPAPVAAMPIPVEQDIEAWTADARQYARRFDVSVGEAVRRLRLQEASVPLTDQLRARWEDRLAGLYIDHKPEWRIVVLLTGSKPVPDQQVLIAGMPVTVAFKVGAPANQAQILNAIDRHQADLRTAIAHPPGMGPDAHTGTLAVMMRPEDLDKGGRAATEERLAAIAGVPVTIRAWADSDKNLSMEAGARVDGMDLSENKRFLCTSGFAVTDGDRTAITTAAHCPNDLSFVRADKSREPLKMIGSWGARYQDVQIHSAEQDIAPLLRADDGERPRYVTSWRNRTSTRAGDFVCHRGERTGYSCSEVMFVDYAMPGDLCAGPCPAYWVAVAGPACKSGDSGGPVFLGTIAFGLTKGGSYTAGGTCKLYYYMSTDYLPEGWRVLTRSNAVSRVASATR